MACSFLAWAAIGAVAAAQSEYRPAPAGMYTVNVSPWPGQQGTTTAQPISGGAGASSSDAVQQAGYRQADSPYHTLRYKKDAHTGEPAAGLAKPKAQENKPKSDKPNGQVQPTPELPNMPAKPTAATKYDPTPQEMFRVESEKELQARIQKDPKHPALVFPPQPTLAATYRPELAPMAIFAEPSYVDYRRLLFEDKNTERYGWNLGPIQPFVSAYEFLGGVVILPYKFFSWPCLRYDSNAGLCLPGDPVPYFLYPPGISLSGAAAEAGIIVALHYIFLIY